MAHIGYTRISNRKQNLVQLEGLVLDTLFEEQASESPFDRPALQACLALLTQGDTLHVESIDRLARNGVMLESLLKDLKNRGIFVHFHSENLVFSPIDSPMQTLLFKVMSAFVQFERANTKERQQTGIAKAKARGQHLGRPMKLSQKDRQEICAKLNNFSSPSSLAEEYKVSVSLIHKIRNANKGNS